MPHIEEQFEINPQWHSQRSHVRVICVGAGAAGLLVAYKMKKNFKNFDLVCYDKNPNVAGTWFENRYPGCACDIPAHVYTYAFEPNPDWSTFYAYAPEIRKYFEDFAVRHELSDYVRLNSKVLSATWDEDAGKYEVEVDVEGKIVKDWCHVLINGTGFLNSWKWPDVKGLHSFAGDLLHSANWDQSVDLKDKRVAVIGTGSSAIQIVPQVQKIAKHVVSFMRSVTWISPPVADAILSDKIDHGASGSDHAANGSDPTPTDRKPNSQYYFSDQEKRAFRENPEALLQFRRRLEENFNSGFDMYIAGSDTSIAVEAGMREEMNRRIGPGHEELKSKLIPSFPPGCKRLTPGDGYLEALVQPNTTCVHKEIAEVVPEGLVDADGELHKVDVLICATGFNIAFSPPFTVTGVDGVDMKQEFGAEPQVYLAVAVPKFPNYFIVNGPRGNWAAGSALPSHEVQVEYILGCVARIQSEDIRAMEVKQEPIDQLYEYIDKWHKRSVWSKECKSWYKPTGPGGKLWIWGGSALHYMKTLKTIRWEHYNLRYRTSNMWSFLGNGRVEAEVLKDTSRLAPYIRTHDEAWNIE